MMARISASVSGPIVLDEYTYDPDKGTGEVVSEFL